jgi:mono/diheme cytochrome c family protein
MQSSIADCDFLRPVTLGWLLLLSVGLLIGVTQTTRAQTPAAGRPPLGQPAGAGPFQTNCASCHTAQGVDLGGRVAPSVASLKATSPEKIHEAMSSGGKMQAQAAPLTHRDKQNIVEFLTGRSISDADGSRALVMTKPCSSNPCPTAWMPFLPGTDGDLT